MKVRRTVAAVAALLALPVTVLASTSPSNAVSMRKFDVKPRAATVDVDRHGIPHFHVTVPKRVLKRYAVGRDKIAVFLMPSSDWSVLDPDNACEFAEYGFEGNPNLLTDRTCLTIRNVLSTGFSPDRRGRVDVPLPLHVSASWAYSIEVGRDMAHGGWMTVTSSSFSPSTVVPAAPNWAQFDVLTKPSASQFHLDVFYRSAASVKTDDFAVEVSAPSVDSSWSIASSSIETKVDGVWRPCGAACDRVAGPLGNPEQITANLVCAYASDSNGKRPTRYRLVFSLVYPALQSLLGTSEPITVTSKPISVR